MQIDPEMYRSILDSVPQGLYVVDRERRIVLWNVAAEKITGYVRHEVIGRNCSDNLLMHCDEQSNVLCGNACPLLHTMHDGRPRETQVYLRHKNGERVPVRVQAVPLHDEMGAIIGAIETFEEHAGAPEPVEEDGHAVIRYHLGAALEEFAARRAPCAVLLIGMERLDKVQHSHGVLAVRALRRAVAHSLAHGLRPGDVVARWSPDRFAIILGATPAQIVPGKAEQLQKIAGCTAIPWWGDRLSTTVSVGAATVRAGDTMESLLARAEDALEKSLMEGGSSIEVAS